MEIFPDIQFLICTIDARIGRIPTMLLPPNSEISYLVSWQQSLDFLEQNRDGHLTDSSLSVLSQRSDVQIIICSGVGLSRNRNCALSHATGSLLVISDDDCIYTWDSINNIRQAFRIHPDASIIQFQGKNKAGVFLHSYPNYSYEYANAPSGTFLSSCELVLRRSSNLPKFDERFGLGAYLGCGEEEIFAFRVHRLGLKIYYIPLVLVETEGTTTGTLFNTNLSVQRAKGGVLCYMFGPFSAILRCVKFVVFDTDLCFVNKICCFYNTLKGIIYEFYTRHSLL